MRTSGRRSGNQQGRRRDEKYGRDEEYGREEEYGRDAEPPGRSAPCAPNADSLIADLAKGFVEAQAKIAGPAAGGGNQEMLAMLDKISRQLDKLQAAPAGQATGPEEGRGGDAREAAGGQGQQPGQQAGGQSQPAELSAIFSQLLSAGKTTGAAPQKGAQETGRTGQEAGKGGGRQGGQAGGQSVAAQTAAQALAQAQYELANELEASLAKLKQVISESEKLADRISNLLGQEGGSRQT